MRKLTLTDIDTSGLTLIEASAGTGKTWTITALYILLVLEEQMRTEEILVVTYTRAATAELRDRIRKRLADTLDLYVSGREPADELESMLMSSGQADAETARRLLTRALYAFDDAAIFTIHGFCQRVLLENAFESGSLFDSEISADQAALVQQVCDDFWRIRIMPEEGPFLERLISDGITPQKLAAPFAGHFQNPELRVIPATGDPDLTPLIELRDALLPTVATLWQAEREAIIQQLCLANLSQTSYKQERIEAAARQLDSELGRAVLLNGGSCLTLFTPHKIQAAMKKGSLLPDHPFFDLCRQLHQAALRVEEAYREKLIHRQRALGEWLRDELARRKQALNRRGYDDLLLDLHLALEGIGGEKLAVSLREKFRAALIDEFQDTDPLQWRIFGRLAGVNSPSQTSYPLFLIGDPKQAIYSFRGADIHAYLAAARATAANRRWTLDTNRRSSATLVKGVNTLFDRDDPFLCRDIAFSAVAAGRARNQQLLQNGRPVEQPLRFWIYQRRDQAKVGDKASARTTTITATVNEIARLLEGSFELVTKDNRQRPLRPGDIAVLVKAHYQAEQVQLALRSLGIPSVQHGSATIFETCESHDLLRILRAAAEPANGALVREALLTAVIGLSANAVFELGRDEEAWETWLMRFRAMHEAALEGGVMAMAAHLLDECGVRLQVLAHTGGERRLTNILHCLELLHESEREHGIGLEATIVWLERRITGEQEDETTLLRLETDEDAVVISTVHASKGLEYPVVFLPFAWDLPGDKNNRVLFHDQNGLVLDLGSDRRETEHKQLARSEQDAEAARLLYVAVTRAEFLCYVAWGCVKGAYGSPLARLLHGTRFKDARTFAAAGDQDILGDLSELAERSRAEDGCHTIAAQFMPLDRPAPPYRPDRAVTTSLICRQLRADISSDWRMSSFSSIAGQGERQIQSRDHDAISRTETWSFSGRTADTGSPVPSPETDYSIFSFPRGAEAGTCLHELFETLDFSRAITSSTDGLFMSCLQRNGYGRQWLPAVSRMVRDVVTAPLIPSDPEFSLTRLTPGSWIAEQEFYLPLKKLNGARLRELFHGLLDPLRHGDFDQILAKLHLQETRGMLLGFIDMVFQYNGRFYIIDWKSNHLGDRRDAYDQRRLCQAMSQHAYILQYHLYTLALDRLLRLRLPGYDYETHFGGAIYLFLRGVAGNDDSWGIYRDRPAREFIHRANQELLAEAACPT